MPRTRYDRVCTVLAALKRAETAKLKARLAQAADARKQAAALRLSSARQAAMTTAAEMRFQSRSQHASEARARALEIEAERTEREAQLLRQKLATTMGQEQAASMLAKQAHATAEKLLERRNETVPERPRP